MTIIPIIRRVSNSFILKTIRLSVMSACDRNSCTKNRPAGKKWKVYVTRPDIPTPGLELLRKA